MSTHDSPPGDHPVEEQTLGASGYELSLCLAIATQAVPNFCYANAWHALRTLPELFAPDGSLVEGWLVREVTEQVEVIEHAWLHLAAGQVIDPTVVFLVRATQPVFFFPGLRHSFTQATSLRVSQLPVARALAAGEGQWSLPSYQAAYETATHKARVLAQREQPPKQVVVLPCRSVPASLVVKVVPSTHFLHGGDDAPAR